MIKSKHFRKDVIIARVVFLCLCIALVAGIIWLISFLTKSPEPDPNGGSESQIESNTDSESESVPDEESESESESESVTEPESESESDVVEKLYVKITAKSLNLRTEPNTSSTVIISLKKGTKVELVEELDGWFKVVYEGQTGYLSSDYATIISE